MHFKFNSTKTKTPMALQLHNLIDISMSYHKFFKIIFSILFISTLLQSTTSTSNLTTNSNSTSTYKKFLKNQCNSTTYPNVCYKSLSPYTSKIKTNFFTLTKISIYLALKSSRSASMMLKKLSSKKLTHDETLVIADCIENIDDTVDVLTQSADGLVHLNGTTSSDEKFQWDTIKTWMSSAITDEGTCTDELDEMEVRSSIQKKIKTSVGKTVFLTSNSLAFVNSLSY
ncbi:pectinesterase inhibitor 4-like [Cicer arietinum]|uniref:Pectinesterase inhibitor 4-like n=1 Tax=Cicer arietinum TaxID=3827 RepID=A0A1S2YLH6_CICAR|nr:pectinesterase inhibitor 4-like [Cicer arietinum]